MPPWLLASLPSRFIRLASTLIGLCKRIRTRPTPKSLEIRCIYSIRYEHEAKQDSLKRKRALLMGEKARRVQGN